MIPRSNGPASGGTSVADGFDASRTGYADSTLQRVTRRRRAAEARTDHRQLAPV